MLDDCAQVGFRHPATKAARQFRADFVADVGSNGLGPLGLSLREGCQILLHRAAGAPRIAVLVPVLTRDRPLLVCVSLDQARVNGKAFATNQTGRNASFNDTFEHATEYIFLAEALVAGS
jgi:hypothetical protein